MNKNDRYYKALLDNYEDAAFKLFIYEQEMENAERLNVNQYLQMWKSMPWMHILE